MKYQLFKEIPDPFCIINQTSIFPWQVLEFFCHHLLGLRSEEKWSFWNSTFFPLYINRCHRINFSLSFHHLTFWQSYRAQDLTLYITTDFPFYQLFQTINLRTKNLFFSHASISNYFSPSDTVIVPILLAFCIPVVFPQLFLIPEVNSWGSCFHLSTSHSPLLNSSYFPQKSCPWMLICTTISLFHWWGW